MSKGIIKSINLLLSNSILPYNERQNLINKKRLIMVGQPLFAPVPNQRKRRKLIRQTM